MTCIASFPGPTQLFVAYSTEKRERALDNLSRAWRHGRENLIERGHTDRKYATQSRLIQCSIVSCVEIDGSRALAIYVNTKCRERLIQTWKRFILAFNSATSQQGHGMAVLASHAEPGAIPESLSRNNAAAV